MASMQIGSDRGAAKRASSLQIIGSSDFNGKKLTPSRKAAKKYL
jgi:hypothetical protein